MKHFDQNENKKLFVQKPQENNENQTKQKVISSLKS
jgi:hypothetical protein